MQLKLYIQLIHATETLNPVVVKQLKLFIQLWPITETICPAVAFD